MKLTGRGQRIVTGLAPPVGVPHSAVKRAAALQLMRSVGRTQFFLVPLVRKGVCHTSPVVVTGAPRHQWNLEILTGLTCGRGSFSLMKRLRLEICFIGMRHQANASCGNRPSSMCTDSAMHPNRTHVGALSPDSATLTSRNPIL